MIRSQQGFNIAFVGIAHKAQTACAEYLKHKRDFKRISMDDPIKNFVRASYNLKGWTNIPWAKRLEFYDAIYKVDPDLFVNNVKFRMNMSNIDTVIWDVRYVNELLALREMGFIICRVTSGARPLHLKKYIGTAESGTVALAMTYDSNYAFKQNVDYSVLWEGYSSTQPIMDAFLERIGYKLDL